MSYVSTKPEPPAENTMTLEELKQGLLELSVEGTEKILRSELIKLITTVGNKLTLNEANQVLSLIPTANGAIDISELISRVQNIAE
ncbi:uncharacterized protein NEMAJ01_2314 [Nematocida major]|uniref:uncharacterized protein n=1 Tax=Nematocida major TaxID=1912982 RepID=UPI0020088FF5|nr:uncharacterized protein NEMAJ01_2314 [Nematocida major]KAH9387418.1 hypothetical protein NEMAJ01_2314 [Nematocida major]